MKVADVRYLAFNGHSGRTCECLLLGVERTLDGGASMSANDPKRTFGWNGRREQMWNKTPYTVGWKTILVLSRPPLPAAWSVEESDIKKP